VTALLDGNVLIALSQPEHVHHFAAKTWFRQSTESFATCPITQGALLRLLLREGATAADARRALLSVVDHERHEFWPDDLGYADVRFAGVVGHRQVTDAYLAALARQRGGSLVTFDRGLAAVHDDVAVVLPE
jgi:uncharacterized protein